jgi:hypothetical protein
MRRGARRTFTHACNCLSVSLSLSLSLSLSVSCCAAFACLSPAFPTDIGSLLCVSFLFFLFKVGAAVGAAGAVVGVAAGVADGAAADGVVGAVMADGEAGVDRDLDGEVRKIRDTRI